MFILQFICYFVLTLSSVIDNNPELEASIPSSIGQFSNLEELYSIFYFWHIFYFSTFLLFYFFYYF